MDQQRKNDLTAGADGIIEGRNAVIEALRAGETIDKIYLQKPPAGWWWRRTRARWTP